MYFSPTGGVKKVMDILAKEIHVDGEIDLAARDGGYEARVFRAEDLCLIGVPSFGGRVPGVALERMRQTRADGAAAVLVVVFGNRAYDDTLPELKNEASGCGFSVGAAITAVAEHSIMRQFAAGRPDEADEAELRRFAREIAQRNEGGKLAKGLTVPGSENYKEYKGVPLRPKAGRACVKCGLCAEKCPVGAIPRDNPASADAGKCISCMRCASVCPKGARRLNKAALFAVSQVMKKALAGRKPNELFM